MLRKKIFDIKPSQESDREEIEIITAKSAEKPKLKTARKLEKTVIFTASLLILLALAASYFFIPHKAKIDIWPKKNNIEERITATVSPTNKGANFVQGEILEIEKVVSQNFAAHGKKIKAAKAHGAVRVYNNYSTAAQTLVATTRFVSNGGKLFRTQERVVIPGGHYEGGKLAAGFIDIEVVADQPGEDYNIDASTFSIPGFAGTPKYTAFYAKSSVPMTGGEKKEVFYITQEDLDEAKDALTKIAPSESDTALRNSIFSGEYILVEGAASIKVDDFKASAELGQELDNFSARVKSTAKAIVFREQQLMEFSKSYLQQKLPSEEKLIESLIKAEYLPQAAHLEKNELILELVISAQSHTAPEAIQIKEMVKNKNIKEVENLLKELSQIERARVEFWPFWVNLAPDSPDKIKVVLHLDGVD